MLVDFLIRKYHPALVYDDENIFKMSWIMSTTLSSDDKIRMSV